MAYLDLCTLMVDMIDQLSMKYLLNTFMVYLSTLMHYHLIILDDQSQFFSCTGLYLKRLISYPTSKCLLKELVDLPSDDDGFLVSEMISYQPNICWNNLPGELPGAAIGFRSVSTW